MTDRETLAVVVAFAATWSLVAYLLYVIGDLRNSLIELGKILRDFVADIEDGCI
jgi:hypothetical protein